MAVTTAPTGRPQARTADRSQDRAERFVRARVAEALGERARLYPNVR
jgi:hypothetical protein